MKSISKKARSLRTIVGSFLPAAALEKVNAVASTIDPTTAYSRDERKPVERGSNRVPDALIERMAALAAKNGGSVLGIAFDVEAARQTLAYASACNAVIDAAHGLIRMISDDVLRRRIRVAQSAFAIYGAMRRLVTTNEGKHLAPSFEELQALMREHNARKRTRTAKAPPADAKANAGAPASK